MNSMATVGNVIATDIMVPSTEAGIQMCTLLCMREPGCTVFCLHDAGGSSTCTLYEEGNTSLVYNGVIFKRT